jgi:DNA-binding Lrp family transcriptional regulator
MGFLEVPMMAATRRDMLMIPYLRQDARISLTALSRKTGIPVATAHERLKLLRKTGLVQPKALVNFEGLGFHSRILVALKLDRDTQDEVEKYLGDHRNVNTVWHIDNGFTLMIDAVFRNMRVAKYFIEDLEKQYEVKKKMIFYILGEAKREAFLSDPVTAGSMFSGSLTGRYRTEKLK